MLHSRRNIALLFLGCFGITSLVSGQEPPSAPAPLRCETLALPGGKGTVHLAIFDSARYTLRVVDNGPRRYPPGFPSLADAVQRQGGVAGTNGGFFDLTTFAPSGMLIAGGRTIAPFDPKGWQEGVLVVRKSGLALTLRQALPGSHEVTDGLQSSPWLLRRGHVGTVEKSDLRSARRAFIGTGPEGWWALGFSTDTTFYDLAEFLRSPAVTRHIALTEVLALDGGPSAGFWCRTDGRETSEPTNTIVRDFVVVVPR